MFIFGKKKARIAPAALAPAPTETPAKEETRIGATITVRGSISGSGAAVISGTVNGDCTVDKAIYLERGGTIEGAAKSGRIHIRGRIVGRVEAGQSVDCSASAQVEADLLTPSLSIEAGALVNGRIEILPAPAGVGHSTGTGERGRNRKRASRTLP